MNLNEKINEKVACGALVAIDNTSKPWKVTAINRGWLTLERNGKTVKKRANQVRSIQDTKANMSQVLRHYRQTYVPCKTAKGHKSASNGDDVANALRAMSISEVYDIGAKMLQSSTEELLGKYGHLNNGQQRMCIGNRLRNLWRKGTIHVRNGQLVLPE